MVRGITKGCKICFTYFNYKYLRNNELVLGTFKNFYAWLDEKKFLSSRHFYLSPEPCYVSSKNRYISMSFVFEIVTSNCYYKIDPKANLDGEILSHVLLSKCPSLVQNAHTYIYKCLRKTLFCVAYIDLDPKPLRPKVMNYF